MKMVYMNFYDGFLRLSAENGKIVECRYCKAKPKAVCDGDGEGKDDKVLRKAVAEIGEYLLGKRRKFTVSIQLQGTEFQKRVWEKLREVPYGLTCSYADLARDAGSPRACRAVGQANGANRLLLLVPCHRVIQADGGLGGFGCGIDVKKYLLNLESKAFRKHQQAI